MEKRLILALVLTWLVFMFFSPFYKKPSSQRTVSPHEELLPLKEEMHRPEQKLSTDSPITGQGEEVEMETDLLRVVFTTEGARVKSWKLKEFKEKDEEGEMRETELVLKNSFPLKINTSSLAYKDLFSGIYKYEYLDENKIKFSRISPNGGKVSKIFTFWDNSYLVDLEVKIENRISGKFRDKYRLTWGPGIREEKKTGGGVGCAPRGVNYGYGEPMSYLKELGKEKGNLIRDSKIKKEVRIVHKGKVFWAALASKYFVAILIPQGEALSTVIESNSQGKVSVEVEVPFSTQKFSLYVGPKKYERLKDCGLNLEEVINFGFLKPVAKTIFFGLKFFYKIGRNYGIAIIMLSVFIKVILFPLAHSSFKSMGAMQEIQPQMTALKEKHKDDPQKMNKEVMKLYKERKVNPLGGCLPLFLQFPIFIALYRVLWDTIELRQANFLWIKDLSTHDPSYILPIIMGATMFIQQKFSPTGSPQQKGMMLFMPIFFTFIFLSFPAGLVLYWLVYNILSIGEQYFIRRR